MKQEWGHIQRSQGDKCSTSDSSLEFRERAKVIESRRLRHQSMEEASGSGRMAEVSARFTDFSMGTAVPRGGNKLVLRE